MEIGVETIEAEKRTLLRRMARVGMPEFQIAFSIGVSPDTLQIFYRDLLTEAKIGVNLHILETLEQLASSGKSASATMFWARSKCEWAASGGKPATEEPPRPHRTFIVTGPNGERK